MSHRIIRLLPLAAMAALLAWGCASGTENTGSTSGDNLPKAGADKGGAGTDTGGNMATVDFEKDVKPMVTEYCSMCHSGANPKAGIDVTKIATNDDAKASAAVFKEMAKEVEAGKMPPPKGKPLSDADRAILVGHLKALSG